MIPSDPVLPDALMLTLKSDAGSFPFPRLWNGPPNASVIGPVRVREPVGTTRSVKLRLPLPTVWEPLKVCLRRVPASPPELLPHAASVIEASAAISSVHNARGPLKR